ncbi:ATP-binding cassette domain-containing protein [Skermania sp. ID1734]|uniref:sulfate/molybdate ABC transporter ATP-binding protein n=1 Tax=Skermania sp. ID1734 TaxID=2597516 RepID=UPI00117CFC2A|nr:ATP-binding cassette domain-containing protein [Skermania sp. ID1734]TSD99275.1 ATP-binding cassette domain-containing protein [Skermania sp. ID1734]
MSGLELSARVDQRDVEVTLSAADGEVVALLGPNGAGKSTVLGMIAGLIRPNRGRITLDERVLTDTDASVAVAPHRRGVALLAQEALLFPHRTVLGNIAFPLECAGVARREAEVQARGWLERVDAVQLADRKPHQLSGGQAQRVAVARALAAEPRLLMLDEPFAALDVSSAPELRNLLRRLVRIQRRTTLLVTHDIVDALTLADRVVVLEDGRVVESGSVHEVLTQPRSAFAARIAGVNLLEGLARPDGVVVGGDVVYGRMDGDCQPGVAASAVFPPAAVAVHLRPPEGSPRNVFRMRVTHVDFHGAAVRVYACEESNADIELMADITPVALRELGIITGLAVYFAVKASEVAIYPR